MKKSVLIWTAALVAVATAALFMLPNEAIKTVDLGKDPKHALDPALGIVSNTTLQELQLRQQEDHPVTAEMKETAASQSKKSAPDFTLIATNGRSYSMTAMTKDQPLLIFFIEKECPCCLGAKHFVESLANAYEGHAQVVGIINADDMVAQTWVKTTAPIFPVLQDPDQTVIRKYAAERGVYTTLIAPGGTIDSAFAGYSKDMLTELSTRIAKLAGVKEARINTTAAPETLTSGCLFPEIENKQK